MLSVSTLGFRASCVPPLDRRQPFEGGLAPSQAFDPKDFLEGLDRFDVRWKIFETNVPVAVEA